MAKDGLVAAIEAARKRLKLSKTEYAARIGLTEQGLRKILEGGGVSGSTLARMKRDGDVRGLGALIETLDGAA